MFYSKTARGFYTPEIHGENMPSDAVEITDEQYEALFEGQANGKEIQGGEDGYPVLVDPEPAEPLPPPTKEQLMAKLLEIQAQLENLA